MVKKNHKKGGMALSQILILLVGTLAFAYLIGQVGFVSAATGCSSTGALTSTTFCYGGTDVGYHVYSFINSYTIKDDRGFYYFYQGNNQWTYSTNSDGSGAQTVSSSGNNLALFTSLSQGIGVSSAQPIYPCTVSSDCNKNGVTGLFCIQPRCYSMNGCLLSGYSQDQCNSFAANSQSTVGTQLPDGSQCSSDTDCMSGYCNIAKNPPTCDVKPSSAGTQASTTSQQPANNPLGDLATAGGAANSLAGAITAGGSLGPGSPCTANTQCSGGNCDSTLHVCIGGSTSRGGSTSGTTPIEQSIDWKMIGGMIVSVIKDLAINAGIAYGAYWLAGQIKSWLGITPGSQWNYAATWGQWLITGTTFGALEVPSLVSAVPAIGSFLGPFWGSAIGGGLIGAGLAVVAFLALYKTTKINAVIVNCIPWQAPTGGNDCDKCGQNGLRCTAYQCASLGQACDLKNSGTGGKPICVWVNKNDVVPPTITFLDAVLPTGYTHAPVNAVYPADTGVLIQSANANGMISPYTMLPLGVTTDKPSECKIDLVRGNNFTDMSFTMIGGIDGSEGLWGYNHTINLPIFQPAPGVNIQKSGQVDVYIRCENANGYADSNAFDIQFVVDTTPDQTPPVIVGESIQNGAPIPFGTTSTTIGVYVNEPVTGCKWSHSNYAYDNMENNMSCTNTINMEGNYAGTFMCSANLDGLKNGVENDYYFACKDLAGNVDTQAYKYALMGTQSLVISSVSPTNGTTIQDSTQSIKVTLNVQTSTGQNQGQATCYYDASADPAGYREFSSSNSYVSTQDLWLPAGSYTYNFKCVDLGGNAAYSSVNFNVQSVNQPPVVIRANHVGTNLNIQTNINASCVYDIVDCTYPIDSGISMSTTDGITFSTTWVAGRTYYIKCQDTFGNQPAPNSCSIVLSPSSV